ncbi:MAG: hypothetical protein ACREM1_19790 [Longimicrobiales bacterium]
MGRAVTQQMHSGGSANRSNAKMADDQDTPHGEPRTPHGGPGSDEILLEVCVECGKEYMSESRAASGLLRCERCGGEVFRSFDAATNQDEAEADFHESTDRDTTPEDGPTEVTRGDLADLGNL